MKNFRNCKAAKCADSEKFTEVEEGIYRTIDPDDGEELYVTSLTFELEDDNFEGGGSPRDIPQEPFDDLLDEFGVYVTDFYEAENEVSEVICYQEFGSSDIGDIRKLRTLIGKRFYAVEDLEDENGSVINTEETNINDFEFEESENCTVAITRYRGEDKEVTIPAEIGGKPVRKIDFRAFADCEELESVVISEGVTEISHRAFQECKSLTSVTMPGSVKIIGEWAFENCKKLEKINVPDSVEELWDDAFAGTPWLENRRRETPLVIIGKYLIDGRKCKGDIEIPDGVTHICGQAFYYCRELTSVKIPESVTDIGRYAFRGCSALENVELADGLTIISESAFCECSALKKIKLPRSVTEIKEGAFSKCESLKEADLPDELTMIASRIFGGCSSLDHILIPDSVSGKGRSRNAPL